MLSAKPLRRIHWTSPIHTDTRASSAAYGLISMPLTLAGPTSGKARLQAERLGRELDAVLEVLECLQGEIQEVAGAASRVEHRESSQALPSNSASHGRITTGSTSGMIFSRSL